MMNHLFAAEIDEGWVLIYMDDILIASETEEQDKEKTKQILNILINNDLYCNLDKCVFGVQKCEYLSLIIQENLVSMELHNGQHQEL